MVHTGFFTVVGKHGRYTFRIEEQQNDAAFAPGKLVIARLTGQDNENSYESFGFVGEDGSLRVWPKRNPGEYTINAARFLLKGDMVGAGKAYAMESVKCWRCNRMLTTPKSIEQGIGPECQRKMDAMTAALKTHLEEAVYAAG